VARGEHHAGVTEVPGGEVELVGGGQPDQDDVRPGLGGAVRERTGHAGRAGAHVVPDDDRGRRHDLDVRAPGGAGERFVELLGDESAHVVRLEDGAEVHRVQGVGHGPEPNGRPDRVSRW
jgi:hypothetical protein